MEVENAATEGVGAARRRGDGPNGVRLGYGPGMPFKHHAARRHHIPKARYQIHNWPAYEAGLKRRGDLTLWVDEAAVAGWIAPRRTTPGGQALYSDVAIQLVLTLRLVFHLALRQAEAFTGSVLRLLGLDLSVPDHHYRQPAQHRDRRQAAAHGSARPGASDYRQHRAQVVRPRRVECRETWPCAPVMAETPCWRGRRHR